MIGFGFKLALTGLLTATAAWAWAVFTDEVGSVADVYGKWIALAGMAAVYVGLMLAVWGVA